MTSLQMLEIIYYISYWCFYFVESMSYLIQVFQFVNFILKVLNIDLNKSSDRSWLANKREGEGWKFPYF